ncbi:hypothetical protein [Ralstonia sp. A12]|uniref:hypothetical protein n=1 Tax=Ralstonia sp. A12 TaxID=1217052 RepID=UPI0012EE42B4|nr:hypothetical protein [Ralstonia sp. A12]
MSAEKRASLTALDAAAANYQGVVLNAFCNGVDALRALDPDANAPLALAAADAEAHDSLESPERQHALGAASYVQFLIAQQHAQQNRLSLIAGRTQRLVDNTMLLRRLRGGYKVRTTA